MKMHTFVLSCVLALAGLVCGAGNAQGIRIKDIGKMAGWRDNALSGYGLVTGLAGTGDSGRNKATRQSIANMLSHFDLTLSAEDVQSRNVAAVMVTAASAIPRMFSGTILTKGCRG